MNNEIISLSQLWLREVQEEEGREEASPVRFVFERQVDADMA